MGPTAIIPEAHVLTYKWELRMNQKNTSNPRSQKCKGCPIPCRAWYFFGSNIHDVGQRNIKWADTLGRSVCKEACVIVTHAATWKTNIQSVSFGYSSLKYETCQNVSWKFTSHTIIRVLTFSATKPPKNAKNEFQLLQSGQCIYTEIKVSFKTTLSL